MNTLKVINRPFFIVVGAAVPSLGISWACLLQREDVCILIFFSKQTALMKATLSSIFLNFLNWSQAATGNVGQQQIQWPLKFFGTGKSWKVMKQFPLVIQKSKKISSAGLCWRGKRFPDCTTAESAVWVYVCLCVFHFFNCFPWETNPYTAKRRSYQTVSTFNFWLQNLEVHPKKGNLN